MSDTAYAYVGGNPVLFMDPTGEFLQAAPVVEAGVEALLNLLGITVVLSSNDPVHISHPFDSSLLDEPYDQPAQTDCKTKSCQNDYPSYILCSSLFEYYYSSKEQAAAANFPRPYKVDKRGKFATDGPQKCIDKGSKHWGVRPVRGKGYFGTVTSCTCCDDSKFGEPELKTKYRAH